VHRASEPNLLIMKSAIRYMYKQSEPKNGGNESSYVPDVEREIGNE
jgi:hypothetical protein